MEKRQIFAGRLLFVVKISSWIVFLIGKLKERWVTKTMLNILTTLDLVCTNKTGRVNRESSVSFFSARHLSFNLLPIDNFFRYSLVSSEIELGYSQYQSIVLLLVVIAFMFSRHRRRFYPRFIIDSMFFLTSIF